MKENSSSNVMKALMLSLLSVGMIISCGGTKETSNQASMVVVFASGNSTIIHGTESVPAKVGLIVRQDDQIKTEKGTLDLQTQTGSAVRVGEFTSITVAQLVGGENGKTKLGVNHGTILANVKKVSKDEDFTVVTPTAIAGVRGTTFSVNVNDSQPVVRVYEGKVAMAPRIRALESATKEDIQKNDTLKTLSVIQEKSEVILEPKMEGSVNPKVAKRIEELNATTEKVEAEKQKPQENRTVQSETIEIAKLLETPNRVAIDTKNINVTPEENLMQKTLITVDKEIVDKLLANRGEGNSEAVDNLIRQRTDKENQILDVISNEATKHKLANNKEIENFYNKLETLVLKDATRISGAVIAQTGNVFVIHTANGVKRINKSDVVSQEMR